ncbi:MAG: 16S rRNA (uracil(1498)-N(3))-methyltransferase [Deltaproteobacteria bacterium]|nr:16S rRNA (uracil(1498)-N(3))-methyltransferase [Deltaproteobacteria bacterium]MBK8238417.1 16S rRNA (uracil(1498)-N(3))-methyltransferase [Deltaproteobacteria bacterium]MBK8717245.1 16S rRNA (uracil(1498)-N(3))-methyltransferase [Deltaproteobacteria bacterium]MBP7286123.1 16S rRNA (uracil(1498)-N(3))-methyltransferase [Nannocystaceae bacterium]
MSVRVFHAGELTPDATVELVGDELHYLVRVRRAAKGDVVEVLDGAGHGARAVLERVDARSATLRVDAAIAYADTPTLELWLGMPDVDATLACITAACELGVTRLTLVRTAFAQAQLPGRARIDRVLQAAMRQCGRPQPPVIAGPLALADLLARTEPRGGWIAWERLRDAAAPSPPRVARLFVGPEGGLREDEVRACEDAGMSACSLGPWTLRAPTAVVAGLGRLRALT